MNDPLEAKRFIDSAQTVTPHSEDPVMAYAEGVADGRAAQNSEHEKMLDMITANDRHIWRHEDCQRRVDRAVLTSGAVELERQKWLRIIGEIQQRQKAIILDAIKQYRLNDEEFLLDRISDGDTVQPERLEQLSDYILSLAQDEIDRILKENGEEP